MPQIIVMARGRADTNEPADMFTERVSAGDFESRHFQNQLVERLSWAVGDAQAVERHELATDVVDDDSGDWSQAAAAEPPSEARDRRPVIDAQPAS